MLAFCARTADNCFNFPLIWPFTWSITPLSRTCSHLITCLLHSFGFKLPDKYHVSTYIHIYIWSAHHSRIWLLSLKLWGSVNHKLWTWLLVTTYLPSNYLIITSFWPRPHLFPKWREKLLSERLQTLDQFPLVLGPLLSLQPRPTTVLTRPHGGVQKILPVGKKYNSFCRTDSQN